MKCLFSIVFVFKLSICVVALSSLYSKLRFSPVAPYQPDHRRRFQNFNIGNKMPKYERAILQCVFVSTTNGSSVQYFASVTR